VVADAVLQENTRQGKRAKAKAKEKHQRKEPAPARLTQEAHEEESGKLDAIFDEWIIQEWAEKAGEEE
jgi:hypothetical protein